MGSDGEFWLRAEVENLPFLEARSGNSTLEPFRHLDFSQELAVITFRLPGGQLFFDQRLLMARSEYFQRMLTSDEWAESRSKEVDFSDDGRVTLKNLSAILRRSISMELIVLLREAVVRRSEGGSSPTT
eukprot:g33617.t1